MNKFNIVTLLVLAVVLLAILSGQTKPQQISQSGRFQLFAGESSALGSPTTDKVILRIDTQTRNVDQWINGSRKNGDLIDMWFRTGTIISSKPRSNDAPLGTLKAL